MHKFRTSYRLVLKGIQCASPYWVNEKGEWINFSKEIFSWGEKRRFRAEANTRRAALLDGQITSGNCTKIYRGKLQEAAYSQEAFRFLASGSIQCSFANETLYPLRVRDELRQIFARSTCVCVCKYDCTHARVIKTYFITMVLFFFYPSVNQKKKKKGGGEPFLVLRLILSGGWFH